MIQSNIVDQASGIQTQQTVDRSETASSPNVSNAVIAGKFKRGIVGRPFTVTNANYKAILGHDPMNPSYLAVEDVFRLGVNKLSILRTGGKGGTGGGVIGGDNGESNTRKPIHFLKVESQIIAADQTRNAGIVYKLNDQAISASIFEPEESSVVRVEAVTPSAMLKGIGGEVLSYEANLLEQTTPPAPAPLNSNDSYIFGVDKGLLTAFFYDITGQSLPEGFPSIEAETVITFYPASKLPSVRIDYDLFDLIVDPASYSQTELEYFSERGAKPAIKNSDGSYTIKSQLILQ